jgi:hypothetical protein
VADLDRRFHLFTEVRPPDLWPEIESREPRVLAPTPRLGTAVVAMVVAVGGIGLAVWAFRAGRPVEPAGPPDEILAFAAPSERFRWEIVTMRADGTERSVVTGAVPGDAGHPSWSPDGSRIAFEVHVQGGGGPEGGAVDVYVVDADGSDAAPLTIDGTSSSPAWSPDGSRIAYVHATPSGNSDIHVMTAEGSTPVRLTTGAAFDLWPAWSPDGSQIAFASDRGGPGTFVMRTDGTEVRRLSREPVVGPSPRRGRRTGRGSPSPAPGTISTPRRSTSSMWRPARPGPSRRKATSSAPRGGRGRRSHRRPLPRLGPTCRANRR